MHTTPRPINFPAFPFPGYSGNDRHPPERPNTGMSFRDYVAVQAMMRMVIPEAANATESRLDSIAEAAYLLSDYMLTHRDLK